MKNEENKPAPAPAGNQQEQRNNRENSGRFSPGRSGNPAGRKRGSKNKSTLAAQGLIGEAAWDVTAKCIELAKEGDHVALKLIMDRILAPVRDIPVNLDLPKIKALRDVKKAINIVTENLGKGGITPEQAKAVGATLAAAAKIFSSESPGLEGLLDGLS